jgi:Ca-activated chloride channel family protein
VLVTDGQVGNEDQLLRLLSQRLGGVRVYTVGVDTAVNEGFLKRLAGLGGGACELVESEDRLDEVMDRVHRRIGTPLLTGLELEPAGLDVDRASLAPGRLPDLFAGSPLVVSGRFEGAPEGDVVVRGRDAAGQPWSATVPTTPGGSPALTATWARAHLRDLEDRYATDPSPDRELERRIVETSLRFGVLCRFTAFVAADVRVVNEGGVVHRVLQPVEAPAGWAMLEWVGLAAAAMPTASMSAAGPFAGRVAGPSGPRGKLDASLGSLPGRAGLGRPGRAGRRRSGGFASQPLGGADLAPYRRRAAQLATLLESDRPLPRLGPPGRVPGLPTTVAGGDLGRRMGLVRVGLEALVADLDSVEVVEEEVRPLRDLASELASLAAPAVPDGARLERLRERALAVLRAFAAPGAARAPSRSPDPTQPPDRRRQRDTGFWRR